MVDDAQRQMALQSEIHATLTHHLPIGMEGIADAQQDAVMAVLTRYGQPLRRAAVHPENRPGLRALQDLALSHEQSRELDPNEDPGCLMCRSTETPDLPVAWPCPVWQVGVMLGVVWDTPVGAAESAAVIPPQGSSVDHPAS